ncbi:MAG: radical SAM protein [Chloroflexi bacterium HGW-Chloroflexi-4]|nr:MAG: radical SAM protein [Chloroflexi bacterium HGW-Chloroflexi-4]PKO00247.1 MAG: radical SAM protein [Chloroflexi bacterium HGW-Chloroflexi-5]
MKVVSSTGKEDSTIVYIIEQENGKLVECVESVIPPFTRMEKWVLLVSTMYGCPVHCAMCDAGGFYKGNPTSEEILEQIDFLVYQRFPDGVIPSKQFKIQFSRMGEPALNPAVLESLKKLPHRYQAPGLMPSISTVAPAKCKRFYDQLIDIKNEFYSAGQFQFQFSIHTTDEKLRDKIIPINKLGFNEMADYGERFYSAGDRKITLNFALAQQSPLDANILKKFFSPEKFIIKITPINPTYRAVEMKLKSHLDISSTNQSDEIVSALRAAGFEVIVSIGNVEENFIGSNCGQYLKTHLNATDKIDNGYTYPII